MVVKWFQMYSNDFKVVAIGFNLFAGCCKLFASGDKCLQNEFKCIKLVARWFQAVADNGNEYASS